MKRLLSLLGCLCIVLSLSYATIACEFKPTCGSGEAQFLKASSDYIDSFGKILSSPVSGAGVSSLLDRSLCCSSPYGQIAFETKPIASACSPDYLQQPILYLTADTNARVSKDNTAMMTQKICARIPNTFSQYTIEVGDDTRYAKAGYTCMFKVNNITSDINNPAGNGLVSDCGATYNSGKQYMYSVWGKLWENVDTLQCNSDCTSKLTGRVNVACSTKVSSCSGIPTECDGSLLGAWVQSAIDSTKEVLCSPSWTETRQRVFSDDGIKVNSHADDCQTIIKKKYTVILDNEQVVMNVFLCQNGDN